MHLELRSCKKLRQLTVGWCGLAWLTLPASLRVLRLQSIPLRWLPALPSLEELHLSSLDVASLGPALPSTLRALHVEYCARLEELPGPLLPSGLRRLSVGHGCTKLQMLPLPLPASLQALRAPSEVLGQLHELAPGEWCCPGLRVHSMESRLGGCDVDGWVKAGS